MEKGPGRFHITPDKKWFLFQEEEQQGPFSGADLRGRLSAGLISNDDLVWTPGMEDWVPLSEIDLPPPVFSPPLQWSPSAKRYLGTRTLPWERKSAAEAADSNRDRVLIRKRRLRILRRAALVAIGLCASGASVLVYQSGIFQGLREMVRADSLDLADVLPEEARELRGALSSPLQGFGPEVALAMSQGDPADPIFYVTTNLPKGTRFEIILEGVPDTLLGQTAASVRVSVEANLMVNIARLGTSTQKPKLPQGEYRVWVVDAPLQPHAAELALKPFVPQKAPLLPAGVFGRVYSQKRYFLGGNKDQAYQRELSNYHSRLREQAESEIQELKQVVATLEHQLTETENRHRAAWDLKQRSTRRAKEEWSRFDAEWRLLQKQLEQMIEGESLERRLHRPMFGLARQTLDWINQTHARQGDQVLDTGASADLEVEIPDRISLARSAILSLKSKTELAERLAPSPSGMPQSLSL